MLFLKVLWPIFILTWTSFVWSASDFHVDLTILHTNDLHSHFDGNGPDRLFTSQVGDGDPVNGHYARLATVIMKAKKATAGPVLVLDAGDFYGGTLFHLIAPRADSVLNPELEFFQMIGLDYTTFGNHEFDAREEGLAAMLGKAHKSGVTFKILSTNLLLNQQAPWASFFGVSESSLVIPRAIRQFGHEGKKIKVGLLGINGPDSLLVCRSNRNFSHFVGFNDVTNRSEIKELYNLLNQEVKNLREKEKVDVVILIAHAGNPEDEKIAKNVDGIDIMIAGHTHDLYVTPKKIGRTWIAEAGEYGKYLGILKFALAPQGLELVNQGQTFLPIDDKVEANQEVIGAINKYKEYLKNVIAPKIGYDSEMPVVTTYKDFSHQRRNNKDLGALVTGGIREQLERQMARPVDFYFSTMSLIRDGLTLYGQSTPYNFSDIFRILSIGMDKEMLPGTPVVHFYLSKREVELLINFMEIYSMISKNFRPAFSPNLTYEERWWGIPMVNRLKNLALNGKPFSEWPELLHVATTNYVASYVDKVGPMTYGLVHFVPKDENGQPMSQVVVTPYKEYQLFTDFLLSKQVLR